VAAVRNSFQRVITEDLTVTGAEPAKKLLDGEQRGESVWASMIFAKTVQAKL
jgi:hypothetical protein